MSLNEPGRMNVHRLPTIMALLSVETVLRDEVVKMVEGKSNPAKDLWTITLGSNTKIKQANDSYLRTLNFIDFRNRLAHLLIAK